MRLSGKNARATLTTPGHNGSGVEVGIGRDLPSCDEQGIAAQVDVGRFQVWSGECEIDVAIHAESICRQPIVPERWRRLLRGRSAVDRHPSMTHASAKALEAIGAKQVIPGQPMLVTPKP